jgi:hypothetical protein
LGETIVKATLGVRDVPIQKLHEQLRNAAGNPVSTIPEMEWDFSFEKVTNKALEFAHFPSNRNQYFHRFSAVQPNNVIFPYLSERRVHQFVEGFTSAYAHSAEGHLATLYPKINRICTSPQLRPLYEESCREVFGFVVTPMAVPNGIQAALEIDAVDQEFIPLNRMGAGILNAVGMIVELLVGKEHIFVIEELENDMHPLALRKLSQLIVKSAAAGNQFFISTHSNVMLREVASAPGSCVFEVLREEDGLPPKSVARKLSPDSSERVRLLRTLGYEFADLVSWDWWLILEESSAERIIREFLIPWFAPRLVGRLRTIASQGADDTREQFRSLHRLLVFLHLDAAREQRIWVCLDGDEAGTASVAKLRSNFPSWPHEHFVQFSANDFESYYPARFRERVQQVLNVGDSQERRRQKKLLLEDVCTFLRSNSESNSALEASAGEIIRVLKAIEHSTLKLEMRSGKQSE